MSDVGIEYDYRIDEICSLEKAGYVVSFGLLDTYISQTKFDLIKNNTFQESLELAIKNDKILNNLNVFIIFDIYLGNVDFMNFDKLKKGLFPICVKSKILDRVEE